jgi:hypothetical protein
VSEPNVQDLASRAAEAESQRASANQTGEETLFSEALALAPELRRDFVERRCRGANRHQAERVMALLESYEKKSTFLDRPAGLPISPRNRDDTPPLPSEPKPGDHIGRYRLLERIGEGGFGVVYLAEQQEPVRRQVALKIIRLGMDTREFIARFEAERQALALMDHPNIARVFDAGATPMGRPYLRAAQSGCTKGHARNSD